MADLNVDLLEASFQAVAPKAEELGERFYDTLFERYPAVAPLFQNVTRKEQEAKLLASISAIVANLRNPEKLGSYLQGLGRRHVGYGAESAHYDAVGAVLLDTLAEVAGDAWTEEMQQAWTDAFGVIKSVMLTGAEQAQHAA